MVTSKRCHQDCHRRLYWGWALRFWGRAPRFWGWAPRFRGWAPWFWGWALWRAQRATACNGALRAPRVAKGPLGQPRTWHLPLQHTTLGDRRATLGDRRATLGDRPTSPKPRPETSKPHRRYPKCSNTQPWEIDAQPWEVGPQPWEIDTQPWEMDPKHRSPTADSQMGLKMGHKLTLWGDPPWGARFWTASAGKVVGLRGFGAETEVLGRRAGEGSSRRGVGGR